MQTSWTTPPLAQAFQLLSIHRGQILKLQQDSHLPLASPLPQQTTTAPLNSLSSHRKNQPQGFVRIFRVRSELRNAKCTYLCLVPRAEARLPFFRWLVPTHTKRQKGENAGKLKFRPQSNVSRSGQQWCAAFHFVCLSQAGGKGGC